MGRIGLMASAAILVAAAPFVLAQAPSPTSLRIVVPVGPGGTSDVVARTIGQRLSQALSVPVTVDNKPGAGGRLAIDAFRAATPDVDVLMVAPIIVRVLAPLTLGSDAYDPRDLVPVAELAEYDYALAVAGSSDVRSVAALLDATRGRKAAFATSAAGSAPHYVGVALNAAAGLDWVHVAYRTIGALEADLVGGHVPCAISATPDFIALHRAGRIRILATTGASRSRMLPDVPTFSELGYANMQVVGWTGLFASRRASTQTIDRWSSLVRTALAETAIQKQFRDLGLEPTGTTPAEFGRIIDRDVAWWRNAIRETGFKAERD